LSLVIDKNKQRKIELISQMKTIIWQQFGTAIDMRENAMEVCLAGLHCTGDSQTGKSGNLVKIEK
jgi:hypothetical protein